jgi:hypothetical protein
MLSSWPVVVGMYSGVTETNLIKTKQRNEEKNGNFVLVVNGTKELKTMSNLLLRSVGLYNGANDRNVYVFRAYIVS